MNDSARPKSARPLTDEQRRLVEENVNLVYSVVYRLIHKGVLPKELTDDAIGEGMYGLLKAAQWYEPERGLKFSTLATIAIEQQAQIAARKERQQTRLATARLDEAISEGDGRNTAELWVDWMPATNDTEREAMQLLEGEVRRILTAHGKPKWAQLVIEHARGRSMNDLAREDGVSRQAVCKKIVKASELLRRTLDRGDWR